MSRKARKARAQTARNKFARRYLLLSHMYHMNQADGINRETAKLNPQQLQLFKQAVGQVRYPA